MMLFSLLCGAATVVTATASTLVTRVSQDVPVDAASSILAPFVSFSIEFSSFPDFAGMNNLFYMDSSPQSLNGINLARY